MAELHQRMSKRRTKFMLLVLDFFVTINRRVTGLITQEDNLFNLVFDSLVDIQHLFEGNFLHPWRSKAVTHAGSWILPMTKSTFCAIF